MTNLYKIMNGSFAYDPETASQIKGLYFTYCDNIPKIKIAGLTFYKIEDLLSIDKLSATKNKRLTSLQPGSSMQLFNIGKSSNLYVVRLTEKEEAILKNFQLEEEKLLEVNKEIESKVGDLLKAKKLHEKNMEAFKKSFK